MSRPARAVVALLTATVAITGCGTPPVRPAAVTPPPAASSWRHGQTFEISAVALAPEDCRVRARLPEPWSFAAWIDVRRAAVAAATRTAGACCAAPRPVQVADWMAGFAAWEITFSCSAG